MTTTTVCIAVKKTHMSLS